MEEDSGVLGNLPRSRPGTRSAKRDAPAAAASRSKRAQARPAPRPPEPSSGADPVGEAVRTVVKVAGAGLKLADGVTRGVLGRLPKP